MPDSQEKSLKARGWAYHLLSHNGMKTDVASEQAALLVTVNLGLGPQEEAGLGLSSKGAGPVAFRGSYVGGSS